MYQTSKTISKRLLLFFLAVVLFFSASPIVFVSAITQVDLNSITNNTPFYNPNDTPNDCSSSTTTTSTTNYLASKNQTAVAQTIIGIAKTDGLGQRGALIGLMAGLAESHLTIYANAKIPVSLTNPIAQAIGHDGTSVGVYQQTPNNNWSTIASGDAALSNQAAVWQLMDPAYSAEAFFGSPPGADVPTALKKGVQNKSNWQTADPWIVAQEVQRSFDSTGSNYKAQMSAAQSLLTKLWDSSPAVPLPVPQTGGSTSATTTSKGGTVFILGDSLSVGMDQSGNLKSQLSAKSWTATVDASVGRTLSQGLVQVSTDTPAIKSSSAIVLELGTNNYSGASAGFTQSLQKLYDAVHSINPTAAYYWMNYTASKEPWKTALVQKSQLLSSFATTNHITVIDWAGSTAAQYTIDDTQMGIHPYKHYPDLAAVVVQALGTSASATGQVNCGTGTAPVIGTGTGKFTDNTAVTFDGVADALRRAKQLADPTSQLFASQCDKIDRSTGKLVYCSGWCDHTTGVVWGHSHSGYESAYNHWLTMVRTGQAHTDRNVPVGAILFYEEDNYPGHAAVYLGNNMVMSTDVLNNQTGRVGGVYITSASSIETGPWHMKYYGWSPPIFSTAKDIP